MSSTNLSNSSSGNQSASISDKPRSILREYYRTVKGSVKHLRRKRGRQAREYEDARGWHHYRELADSLLSDPDDFPRGTGACCIHNIHTDTIEEISLNPKFDAVENAELLYRKARKGERGEEIARDKLEKTDTELHAVESIGEQIRGLLDGEAVESLSDEQVGRIRERMISCGLRCDGDAAAQEQAKQREKVPFRRFVFDGWEVLIGRNNTQNDELSIRYAHPRDIWLHVAAHAGSHVVIRREKNADWPPRNVLEKAGALAVWFSKARHTSYAEVHVTERRYVHKRRKAPPGEVVAERCKSIRVSPRDPRQIAGGE